LTKPPFVPCSEQRLIDQMRTEIEQEAGARPARVLPIVAGQAPEAIPIHLAQHDLAEPAGLDERAHGAEIAVPAAVVEDAQHPRARRRQRDQRVGLRHARRERLVDHDMLARLQRRLRQREMGGVGCGKDDEVDRGIGDRRQWIAHRRDALGHRPRGRDRRQLQPLRRADQRRVEGPPAKAVADQRDADRRHQCAASGAPTPPSVTRARRAASAKTRITT
jgi:hypothetical protein